MMTQIQITLNNKAGLHARPAGLLVRLLNEYKSEVTVEKNGRNVNCKSLMGLLSIGATNGDELSITADGSDEKEAVKALNHFFSEVLLNE